MFNSISKEEIYLHFEKFFANKEALRQRVKKWIPQKCHILLDLGCKSGAITSSYTDKSQKVIGIDKDYNHLQKASKKYPQMSFINGDVSFLPFKDSCAEVVIATEILQYIPGIEKIFYEAHRVLKPNGALFISLPQKGILYNYLKFLNYDELKALLKNKNRTHQKEPPTHLHSLTEIANLSRGLFIVEKHQQRGFILYPLSYLFMRIIIRLTLIFLPDLRKQKENFIKILFSNFLFLFFKLSFFLLELFMVLDSNLDFGKFSYSLLLSMRKV